MIRSCISNFTEELAAAKGITECEGNTTAVCGLKEKHLRLNT